MKIVRRRMRMNWLVSWLPFLLVVLVGVVEAQITGDVQLDYPAALR